MSGEKGAWMGRVWDAKKSDLSLKICSLFAYLPTTSMLLQVVVSCVEDSPAARAAIHEGDELVEINGV